MEGLPVRARPDTFGYRTTKFIRRNRLSVIAAVLVTVSLILGLGLAVWQARVAAMERNQAHLETLRTEQVAELLMRLLETLDPYSETKPDTLTARAFLDQGVRLIDRDLGEQPEIQADLADLIARIYTNLGFHRESTSLKGKAFQIRQRLEEPDHGSALSRLTSLASLLRAQGEYEAARDVYHEMLSIQQSTPGVQQHEVARTQYQLASLHNLTGDLETALSLLRALLARELPSNLSLKARRLLAVVLIVKGEFTVSAR